MQQFKHGENVKLYSVLGKKCPLINKVYTVIEATVLIWIQIPNCSGHGKSSGLCLQLLQ